MKLIIGLGNPGEEYEKTRHNVGFMVLDNFLHYPPSPNPLPSGERTKVRGDWKLEKKFKAEITTGTFLQRSLKEGAREEKIILAKPQTFMNNSGNSVKILTKTYNLKPNNLFIVHDDIDLPLGAIRISFGAGSAGHKGVQSIINSLKTKDFWRLRIGISPVAETAKPRVHPVEKFVLKTFKKTEIKLLNEVIDKACEALMMAMENPEKAMSVYNK